MLIDLRIGAAKVVGDEDPQRLYLYYCSLERPWKDGLVIADARPVGEVEQMFMLAGSVWAPPTFFTVCRATWKKIPLYRIFKGRLCDGGRWHALPGGGANFTAYSSPPPGRDLLELCYAENKQHDVQHVLPGTTFAADWKNLKWEGEDWLYVAKCGPPWSHLQVSTRTVRQPSSRIIPTSFANGEDFVRDLQFYSAMAEPLSPAVVVLCIAKQARTGCLA